MQTITCVLLTNGVLGIQRGTEPGVMMDMFPGVSKAVTFHGCGTPCDAFWCCYGTGNLYNYRLIWFLELLDKEKHINFEVSVFVSVHRNWIFIDFKEDGEISSWIQPLLPHCLWGYAMFFNLSLSLINFSLIHRL